MHASAAEVDCPASPAPTEIDTQSPAPTEIDTPIPEVDERAQRQALIAEVELAMAMLEFMQQATTASCMEPVV